MPTLDVYVPHPDSDLREAIWPASGIVGSEMGTTDRIRVDFEGDGEVYSTFKDRLRRAAERHLWSDNSRQGYPTRACAYVDSDELIRVGRYDPDRHELEVVSRSLLDEWLGQGEQASDPSS